MKNNYRQVLNVKRGWTKIPNAIRHDEKLTSDAKVVIEELLSVSGNYHISEAGIASSVHMSLERVKKAVRLLRSAGYIQIIKAKDGSRFGGYEWLISDVSGTFRETENQALGNQASENPDNLGGNSERRKTERSETERLETLPIYQMTEGSNTNHQKQKDEHTEEDEPLHHQPDVEEAETLPPYIPSSFTESSSVANAPSPASKNTGSGEQVMTQREFEFQQFLKKYPKAPLARELEDTRRAFFEATGLDGSFAEIMAGLDAWCGSAEWRRDNGRWIKKPMNWLKERQWKPTEDLLSDARKRQLDELFPTEEGLI